MTSSRVLGGKKPLTDPAPVQPRPTPPLLVSAEPPRRPPAPAWAPAQPAARRAHDDGARRLAAELDPLVVDLLRLHREARDQLETLADEIQHARTGRRPAAAVAGKARAALLVLDWCDAVAEDLAAGVAAAGHGCATRPVAEVIDAAVARARGRWPHLFVQPACTLDPHGGLLRVDGDRLEGLMAAAVDLLAATRHGGAGELAIEVSGGREEVELRLAVHGGTADAGAEPPDRTAERVWRLAAALDCEVETGPDDDGCAVTLRLPRRIPI